MQGTTSGYIKPEPGCKNKVILSTGCWWEWGKVPTVLGRPPFIRHHASAAWCRRYGKDNSAPWGYRFCCSKTHRSFSKEPYSDWNLEDNCVWTGQRAGKQSNTRKPKNQSGWAKSTGSWCESVLKREAETRLERALGPVNDSALFCCCGKEKRGKWMQNSWRV